MGIIKYYPGYRVGTLILLSIVGRNAHGKNLWKVLCDCGREDVKAASELSSQQSCSRECIFHKGKPRKHPIGTEKEYRAWKDLCRRCTDPEHRLYGYYGGRGITVCEEWKDDFLAFYSHIGPTPSSDMTVDRKENNKGYEPGNVRWATRVEQSNNRRNTIMLTANGATKPLAEWARELGVWHSKLFRRYEAGWPHQDIINKP